jgi:hypothetical protein
MLITPRRRKPSKSVEKAARSVMDSDDFVQHIANIADRYRREHALDLGPRARAIRQSLRTFHKHAAALTVWLHQAQQETGGFAELDALNKIGMALYGSPVLAHAESKNVVAWLSQAEKAAGRCVADAKASGGKRDRTAPRLAAEGLRATFEHHKLKLSASTTKNKPSPAVRLLCAIANSAGDPDFTAEDAKKSLLESGRRESTTAQPKPMAQPMAKPIARSMTRPMR